MHQTYLFVSGMSGFAANYLTRVDTNDVRFTDVFYNEGNDYNATTGVFTCRIPDIYWFSATLYGNSGAYCNILLYGAKKAFVGQCLCHWNGL